MRRSLRRRVWSVVVAALFIAFMVTASNMGFFGDMFTGVFGTLGPAATPGSGPTAGSATQVRLTPTVTTSR